jgi:predicted dehydrogenase
MKNNDANSRRKFLQQIGATSILAATTPFSAMASSEKAEERIMTYNRKITANDKIRIGVIGYGVQGHFDLRTALKVPGVELAGICDLYQGRLVNAKEQFGDQLFTTNNYKDLLNRSDIDAVLICTTDVWHARITLDALAKGKHVYCEKPMVFKINEGYPVIEAAKKSGKVVQVGS